MAQIQEVKDAIAAEKAEVKTRLDELVQTVTDLKAQLADGTHVTPEDLDDLITGIKGIFTPETPPVA